MKKVFTIISILFLAISLQAQSVSVPTQAEIQAKASTSSRSKMIDNGNTVVYKGVTFTVQTGPKGGRFFWFKNEKGEVVKKYLPKK